MKPGRRRRHTRCFAGIIIRGAGKAIISDHTGGREGGEGDAGGRNVRHLGTAGTRSRVPDRRIGEKNA